MNKKDDKKIEISIFPLTDNDVDIIAQSIFTCFYSDKFDFDYKSPFVEKDVENLKKTIKEVIYVQKLHGYHIKKN